MLASAGYPGKWKTGNDGIDGLTPVRVLNFAAGYYTDDGRGKAFADLNVYSRTGPTWVLQMVAGTLELVEIADGVAPFSVDPETGRVRGIDVMPAVTRKNVRYMPNTAQLTAIGGGTMADLSLGALGHFPGVKIASGGAVTDGAKSAAADNVALTAGTDYSFEFLIREDEIGTVRFGFQSQAGGLSTTLEYTFATRTVTVVATGAGTITFLPGLEDGALWLDGSHRITAIFTPGVTDDFKAVFLANSTTTGDGFTLLAWFVYNIASGQPLPVLGAQGATYTTNDAGLTGSKTVADTQTIVMFARHLTHSGNWRDLLQWQDSSATGNHLSLDTHLAGSTYRMYMYHATDADVTNWNPITRQYGKRFGVGFSKAQNIQRSVFHLPPSIDPQDNAATQGAYTLDGYGLGSGVAGTGPVGAVIEKALMFDVVLTQDQLNRLVQRGY